MLKVNQYFDGNVASISFQTATLPATVGVMKIGEYEFGTSQFETMTVVSGAISVLLPNATEWQTFSPSEQFTIEANQKFKVKVDVESAYLCTYEDK
ncbi:MULTISPECIES: pyrimidine/purine nucleoside phosphorylase [unclassified Moraxella]|uniref:pyrimidine/purine nucleoside phosphorylase n=1 Tax=unclassified Moraxella TaxID=2685852 RepID=UPI003AF651D8